MRWAIRRVLVTGPSMAPALRHGDQLLVRFGPRAGRSRVGSVVVVALPDRPLAVKRVVRVESDGRLWIEGDNPAASTDSRELGSVSADAVRGRVLLRLWPRPGHVPPSHWPAEI
ncbi:MAG: hypothetical protein QOF18_1668 [Frankiaceae bacterium]|nr:hypothetical protein [Frankiaceae bacterium]